MAVTYADEAEVMRLLGMVDPTAEQEARVAQLNEELSRVFDEKTGRTFGGGTVAPTTRECTGYPAQTLVLPWPAVSIAGIAEGGTWDGMAFAGQTTLAAAEWRPWNVDTEGRIWAIRRENGAWSREVRITGVWADNPGGDVPADVGVAVRT